jgi:predicted transcriptional regulator
MSKAVLISIRPKWVEKIANGKKTIEVRKTKPKLETPFKCYIYCTRDKHLAFMQNQTGTNLIACMDVDTAIPVGGAIGNGKVIGEFTCDRIYEIRKRGIPENFDYCYLSLNEWGNDDIETEIKAISASCVSKEELNAYGAKAPLLYGWHISDLRIYDTPKELSEFKTLCRVDADCCACPYYNYTKMGCDGRVIGRPPQNWCYVDDVQAK